MRRAVMLLAAALPLLSGCPIPQPLAEVSKTGTTFTPPRILNDPATLSPMATRIRYNSDCAAGSRQSFTLSASIGEDNIEVVDDYRWFVDYDPTISPLYTPRASGQVLAPDAPPRNVRVVPAFTVVPGDYDALEGAVRTHVAELVVSNGFAGGDQSLLPFPWRTPDSTHEVQSFRWAFEPAPGLGTCP